MSDSAHLIVDHRNVGAAFRRLSIPIAVQSLADQLLGIVDTIAIGTFGAAALAGATSAIAVFLALVSGLFGIAAGFGIIASQRIGANDMNGYARTVRAGAVIPLIVSVLCAIASLFCAQPIIHAMLGDAPGARDGATYFTLRCISLVPITISSVLIVALGAAGNRRLGMYILAVVNIVHIPLVCVLALGWFTHHPYGMVGAGVSSLISEIVASIYAIVYVARRPMYRIFASRTIDLRLALRCAQLGTPEATFLMLLMLPDAFCVSLLAPLGTKIVAAFRALTIVSDATFIVPVPLQGATQTVVGQRIGARDHDGAAWFVGRARGIAVRVALGFGILAAVLSWPLAYVFTLSSELASIAAWPLVIHVLALPIKAWAMVTLAPIRAAGDTRFSMLMGILSSVLVVPLVWLGITRLHLALFAVPLAWVIAWTLRGAATEWKFRTGAWLAADEALALG